MRQRLCTLLMLLPCLSACGQQGYVDYAEVVRSLPGYLAAQKIVDARARHWQDSIKVRIKAFTDFLENERPHNRKLDPREARALEDTIHAMQENIQQFQAYAQREIKKVEKLSDAQLKEYVIMKLQEFCTTKGILCVVDKDSILYCCDCVDYTEDFLDYLGRNK